MTKKTLRFLVNAKKGAEFVCRPPENVEPPK